MNELITPIQDEIPLYMPSAYNIVLVNETKHGDKD